MSLVIRAPQTIAEFKRIEDLQREVWGVPYAHFTDVTMFTVQKNGGVVLAAYDTAQAPEKPVGFVGGFLGRTEQGEYKHASHVMGILPRYQSGGLGYRLKLAQREAVLQQGLDLITWTFDPLESRNAYLNLHKLGAVATCYLPDHYGDQPGLNSGLPTDRCQVDWYIDSLHVRRRLQHPLPPTPEPYPLINPAPADAPDQPAADILPFSARRHLVRFPTAIQTIKQDDRPTALAWRLQIRRILQSAFDQGFAATDVRRRGDWSFYVLEQAWPGP